MVWEIPIPPLQVPDYDSSGTYPQVGGVSGLRPGTFTAINNSLDSLLLGAENDYAESAKWSESNHGFTATLTRAELLDPGIFNVSSNPNFISASSVVVSALLPVVELYPSGTEGSVWLSITLRTRTDQLVNISDLFNPNKKGLQALANEVQKRFMSSNSCGETRPLDATEKFYLLKGSAPIARNYSTFALTPQGLTVGFTQGQICALGIGRVAVTVPYSSLRLYLSTLGQRLIDGVRAPIH